MYVSDFLLLFSLWSLSVLSLEVLSGTCSTHDACISQSMPQEVIHNYELKMITLDYRRECQHNDAVDSLTSPEHGEDGALKMTNGSASAAKDWDGCPQFLHLLRLSHDGLEINRGRTEWRKKTAKR